MGNGIESGIQRTSSSDYDQSTKNDNTKSQNIYHDSIELTLNPTPLISDLNKEIVKQRDPKTIGSLGLVNRFFNSIVSQDARFWFCQYIDKPSTWITIPSDMDLEDPYVKDWVKFTLGNSYNKKLKENLMPFFDEAMLDPDIARYFSDPKTGETELKFKLFTSLCAIDLPLHKNKGILDAIKLGKITVNQILAHASDWMPHINNDTGQYHVNMSNSIASKVWGEPLAIRCAKFLISKPMTSLYKQHPVFNFRNAQTVCKLIPDPPEPQYLKQVESDLQRRFQGDISRIGTKELEDWLIDRIRNGPSKTN